MIKPRKQLPFALLLSIGIHVIIFSILYISFSKTTTTAVYHDEVVKYKKNDELSDKIINNEASNIGAIETMEENKQKHSSPTNQLDVLQTEYESASSKENTVKTHELIEAQTVSAETAIHVEQPIQSKAALNQDKESALITGVNDTGLLPTDLPDHTESVNKSESVLKTELEEINAQLSAAINEVKERNQEKISQQRQQQLYVSDD